MSFQEIQVFPGEHIPGAVYQVKFYNPTSLGFIGAGAQGAVFQLDHERCVKIYADPTDTSLEAFSLIAAASASFMPKLYEVGSNYIIMEFIHGPGIKPYLASLPVFPPYIAEQLIRIIQEMKRVGFTRVDSALRHIYVTPQLTLKIIDHVNSYRIVQPYPVRMLQSLSNIGALSSFLHYAEHHDPALVAEWRQASILPAI